MYAGVEQEKCLAIEPEICIYLLLSYLTPITCLNRKSSITLC